MIRRSLWPEDHASPTNREPKTPRRERSTNRRERQQLIVRMKAPGMTLLVVAAYVVLVESQGDAVNDIDSNTWCNENMENQSNFEDMLYYCLELMNQLMVPDVEKGCEGLYYVRKSRHLYDSEYDVYFNTADLLYDKLCVKPTVTTTTTTTTTITGSVAPPEECGKSGSLISESRKLWGGFGRIVGGRKVKDCSVVPWQVRLQVRHSLCGGSIISDRHILTASHCLAQAQDAGDVNVTLADHHVIDEDVYERMMPVKNITRHEDYDPYTYTSDIAILTLKDRIQFDNPCMAKICRDPSFQFDGDYCIVTGWGATLDGGRGSKVLQMVNVKVHKGDRCDSEFDIRDPGYVYDKQKMICAGHLYGGKDSCQGDSGGPLVCLDSTTDRFVQVGVVSFGLGCAYASLPGVYTNIAYYNGWIHKIMSENDDGN